MKVSAALILTATVALAPAVQAQTDVRKTSGFPGDVGRPFNGLPLPDGPRAPPPDRLPLAAGPDIDLAVEAAKTAVAECKGFRVAVSIIDAAGMPKLYYVPNGTIGYHAYIAFRKAWTALSFKMPTSEVGALTKKDPAVAARIVGDPNLLSFAGGVPIYSKGNIVGAIGVSGAEPSEADERCAAAGLKVIQARLD